MQGVIIGSRSMTSKSFDLPPCVHAPIRRFEGHLSHNLYSPRTFCFDDLLCSWPLRRVRAQYCGYLMQQPLIFGCMVFLWIDPYLVHNGCVGESACIRWGSNRYITAHRRSAIMQQALVFYPGWRNPQVPFVRP